MGRSDKDDGKINGLIDKGCSIEGRLTFDGAVQINGDFRGDIASDGTLIVGPEANVEGNIQVGTTIIEGNVKGTIEAKNRIDLRKGSKIVASIITGSLTIEDGAIFHGECSMLVGTEKSVESDLEYSSGSDESKEDGDSLMM